MDRDPTREPVRRSLRPLAALAALGAAALVGLLGRCAWRASPGGSRLATSTAAPLPGIPGGQLVTLPARVAAPALDLPTADGGRVSLTRATGQVVVVNFWASWCTPCAQELPSLVRLAQDLAVRYPGKVSVVAVSVDEEPGAVARFFSTPAYGGQPRDLVVALDPGGGEATRGFRCLGRGACRPEDARYPESYIVDRAGRLAAMVVGPADWTAPATRLFIEALIEG